MDMTATLPQAAAESNQEPFSGAYFWLVAFFVVYCARPEDWIPGLHGLPLAKITGLFAFLALVLGAGAWRKLPREVVYLILLFAQMCLTVPFASWRGGAFLHTVDFAKVVVSVLVLVVAVTTLARLRRLLFVQAACVAAVAAVSIVKGRQMGGRLEGVLGGDYSNSNDLALVIVLNMPLCLVSLLQTRSGPKKLIWCGALLVMTYTVFLTGSRSGLVAFVLTMGICLWEFGVRGRRYYLVLIASVVAMVSLPVFGGKVIHRFNAALGYELNSREDESARGSAIKRWELFTKSLVVTAEHPLLGVGPGNFESYTGTWQVTHNAYTQMSSEGGIPALILYVLILWRAFKNLGMLRRRVADQTEQVLITGALRASLVGFIVGSFFASVAYNYFPYFAVAYTSSLVNIAGVENTPARV